MTLRKQRRRLAQADPAAYRADLAASLNDLGLRLSEAEQTEQALAAMHEAIEIIRRLAPPQATSALLALYRTPRTSRTSQTSPPWPPLAGTLWH